jgi:nucleotide-binding universal stress UspA family protein
MKILMGIDDSTTAAVLARALTSQRSSQGKEVCVLHVVPPLAFTTAPQMAAGYSPELEKEMSDSQALVEQTANTLREAGFDADTAVAKGDIRATILDMASEWGADLILLGSHGRTHLQRFLLGSVAEFVSRHAPCSVEIVRNPELNR